MDAEELHKLNIIHMGPHGGKIWVGEETCCGISTNTGHKYHLGFMGEKKKRIKRKNLVE